MSVPKEVTDRAKEGKPPPASGFLGGELKNGWIVLMRPVEDFLIARRVHPNALTVTSLVVSALAGLLFYCGWTFVGGVVLLAGSTFDMLDGRVARAQGLATPRGAFFDSTLDRVAEVLVFLGLLGYFRDGLFLYVVFLLVAASTMVSYTRARAEGLGIRCDIGMMQRPERIVYLGVAAVFNPFGNLAARALGVGVEDVVLKGALLLILVFSAATAVQRTLHVMRALDSGGAKRR